MKIEDQFRVDVPIEEAWRVLLDVDTHDNRRIFDQALPTVDDLDQLVE